MTEPKVLYDVEFYFTDGDTHSVTNAQLEDIACDDARVKVTTSPDEDTVIEDIIDRTKLNRMRTTKRTVKPEPSVVQ